ncbi:F-box only protein 36-like [Actinia tenebrosa]|uniref:F-box only protein 36-like n=1 Tax=Actinia tenebrosa TaxID=6105 RepID=A0A6P8IXT1_ACTTE|nr:F-box only protein 36-like [Actinia tenebrosa]
MTESRVVFKKEGVAPPPSKDFYQLTVQADRHVIWRSWSINLRISDSRSPAQSIFSSEEFIEKKSLQTEIARVLGCDTLEQVLNIVSPASSYSLEDLPEDVIRKICLNLEPESIGRLAQTSKRLRAVCYTDELWSILFKKSNGSVEKDIESAAEVVGWRTLFMSSTLQCKRFNNKIDKSSGTKPWVLFS